MIGAKYSAEIASHCVLGFELCVQLADDALREVFRPWGAPLSDSTLSGFPVAVWPFLTPRSWMAYPG